MSAAIVREIEAFLRSLRQSLSARDIKAYRGHFWTNRAFVHVDITGRIDHGWGAHEEVIDQEFRYLESEQLAFKEPQIHGHGDETFTVVAQFKLDAVDPGGREQSTTGVASLVIVRMSGDFKIVLAHYSKAPEEVF
ncbi:MAG: hypothetical protein CSA62_11930 [Planctomycetota bacterium]|nr:MAG: hypothetical protein CSA62_11930 [Planctomycetota bacterium]